MLECTKGRTNIMLCILGEDCGVMVSKAVWLASMSPPTGNELAYISHAVAVLSF